MFAISYDPCLDASRASKRSSVVAARGAGKVASLGNDSDGAELAGRRGLRTGGTEACGGELAGILVVTQHVASLPPLVLSGIGVYCLFAMIGS